MFLIVKDLPITQLFIFIAGFGWPWWCRGGLILVMWSDMWRCNIQSVISNIFTWHLIDLMNIHDMVVLVQDDWSTVKWQFVGYVEFSKVYSGLRCLILLNVYTYSTYLYTVTCWHIYCKDFLLDIVCSFPKVVQML